MNPTCLSPIMIIKSAILAAVVFVMGLTAVGPVYAGLITDDSTSTTVTLSWTAPGDDGDSGIASVYDIRYSTSMIEEANWNSASQVDNEPPPQPAGALESYVVTNLIPSTTYYFAIKAADEANNWSGMSNVATKSTGAEQTPPSDIDDLLAINPTVNAITLSWTAPGDDGDSGQAAEYDIRYATAPINDANWGAATQVLNEPTPQAAGNAESFTISGLESNQTYYFAIKASDEVPNWSNISNVASGSTEQEPDQIAPAAIANLQYSDVTENSITITWTAPGDDGNVGQATTYDIRYSTSQINEGNWYVAVQVDGEPTPRDAGSQEQFTVTGLQPEVTYYIAVKTADEVSNWSPISNVVQTVTPDQTPPAAIDDLSAVTGSDLGTIDISWTSPGDDGLEGTAEYYIIKVSPHLINESNWNQAPTLNDPPSPQEGGSLQAFTLTGLNPGMAFYIAMKSADNYDNQSPMSNLVSAEARAFGLDDIDDLASLPTEYKLRQNYPNPFNPTTTINFSLPEPSHVNLVIYDSRGRKVATLAEGLYEAGYYSIDWRGREDNGAYAATGVYLYNLQANKYVESKKMILLK